MVASKYSVLLDTNILMSKTLRDWILLLAVKSEYEFFTPHVSSGVMDEFGYHVRRANLMLALRDSRRLIFRGHLNEQERVNLPVILGL